MRRPTNAVDVIATLVKAILIAAAILFLGSFFGMNVREAGGSIPQNLALFWSGPV